MSEIELSSEVLSLALGPQRGGEIRSLVYRPSGEELLFQAPWRVREPAAGVADAASWTAAWPGGWTLLFPNAGNECDVDGRRHGFHGGASLERWDLVARERESVVLAWSDASGLAVRRTICLHANRVDVENVVENESGTPVAFLLVEHLILGERLAGPGAVVSSGGRRVVRLADSGEALGEPEPWPTSDGWDRAPDEPFARFGGLVAPEERRIAVERDGLRVDVRWDGLPALWLWHEHGENTSFPEGRRITCLGLEPASAAGAEGLARSIEDGEALVLDPGQRMGTATTVAVLG